jgi:CheY-like chemotaxis protein
MSIRHKQAHILVVEDDRDIREAVVEVLEDEGYGVSAAGDGAQALRVLDEAEQQPDLILLDLMMPTASSSGGTNSRTRGSPRFRSRRSPPTGKQRARPSSCA